MYQKYLCFLLIVGWATADSASISPTCSPGDYPIDSMSPSSTTSLSGSPAAASYSPSPSGAAAASESPSPSTSAGPASYSPSVSTSPAVVASESPSSGASYSPSPSGGASYSASPVAASSSSSPAAGASYSSSPSYSASQGASASYSSSVSVSAAAGVSYSSSPAAGTVTATSSPSRSHKVRVTRTPSRTASASYSPFPNYPTPPPASATPTTSPFVPASQSPAASPCVVTGDVQILLNGGQITVSITVSCFVSVTVSVTIVSQPLTLNAGAVLAVNAPIVTDVLNLLANAQIYLRQANIVAASANLNGVIQVDLNDDTTAMLQVSGAVNINAGARVTLVVNDGFSFDVGDRIVFMSYASITGSFDSCNIVALSGSVVFTYFASVECANGKCTIVGLPSLPSPSVAPTPQACPGDVSIFIQGQTFMGRICFFIVDVAATLQNLLQITAGSLLQLDNDVNAIDVILVADAKLKIHKGKLKAKSIRLFGEIEVTVGDTDDDQHVDCDGPVQLGGTLKVVLKATVDFSIGKKITFLKFKAKFGAFANFRVLTEGDNTRGAHPTLRDVPAQLVCDDSSCSIVSVAADSGTVFPSSGSTAGVSASPSSFLQAVGSTSGGSTTTDTNTDADRQKRLGLGLGLGLGIPVVIALIVGLVVAAAASRRRRGAAAAQNYDVEQTRYASSVNSGGYGGYTDGYTQGGYTQSGYTTSSGYTQTY